MSFEKTEIRASRMINPMQMKTPDERRAIAAKAHATRRARKAAAEALRVDASARVVALKAEIAALERKRDSLLAHQEASAVAFRLTGQTLLRESEIVAGAMPWSSNSGIYFLVKGGAVVYVGQAIDVFVRVPQHKKSKGFDAVAFVPCPPELLDKLESLYIHVLRPPLNATMRNGLKLAPLTLDALLSPGPLPRGEGEQSPAHCQLPAAN